MSGCIRVSLNRRTSGAFWALLIMLVLGMAALSLGIACGGDDDDDDDDASDDDSADDDSTDDDDDDDGDDDSSDDDTGDDDTSDDDDDDDSTGAKTHDVQISGFAMDPVSIDIKTGDTVRWTNKNATKHTVTSGERDAGDAGDLFDSENMEQDETFEFTFSTAGDYEYHCKNHKAMNDYFVNVTD